MVFDEDTATTSHLQNLESLPGKKENYISVPGQNMTLEGEYSYSSQGLKFA